MLFGDKFNILFGWFGDIYPSNIFIFNDFHLKYINFI